MARMSVNGSDFEGTSNLLPTTVIKMVNEVNREIPVEYLAEVTGAKEKVSAANNPYLELTVAVTHPATGERVYITDIFSYTKRALWKLEQLVNVFGLSKDGLDTDSFLGRFVFITVFHEERDGRKYNKVRAYIRQATEADMNPANSQEDAMSFEQLEELRKKAVEDGINKAKQEGMGDMEGTPANGSLQWP